MSLGDLNKSPWENYLKGGGLQSNEIIKSTLFCKVHYVLNSDIKPISSGKHKLAYNVFVAI
jgi:hypothetical protein